MSAGVLIEELKRLGVELRAVGNDLEYEGPEEVISAGLLERLKAHKADLVAIYSKTETVAEEGCKPADVVRLWTAAAPETRRLLAAGWESKERCEKIIWKHPESGFYFSQEMAVHYLDNGIGNAWCKSGAFERR